MAGPLCTPMRTFRVCQSDPVPLLRRSAGSSETSVLVFCRVKFCKSFCTAEEEWGGKPTMCQAPGIWCT